MPRKDILSFSSVTAPKLVVVSSNFLFKDVIVVSCSAIVVLSSPVFLFIAAMESKTFLRILNRLVFKKVWRIAND